MHKEMQLGDFDIDDGQRLGGNSKISWTKLGSTLIESNSSTNVSLFSTLEEELQVAVVLHISGFPVGKGRDGKGKSLEGKFQAGKMDRKMGKTVPP